MRSGRSEPNLDRRSRVGASSGESWRLAPATTHPTGMPLPLTISERLVPCLARSTGLEPAACPPHGASTTHPSTHRSVGSRPTILS